MPKTSQHQDQTRINEEQRLEALRRFGTAEALPDGTFDHLTALAADMLGMPMAFLSLIDDESQWFVSRAGLDLSRISRDLSFCAHAIRGSEPMVVPDALRDDRFRESPLVQGEPHVRFYAGTSLLTADGHALGTLGVFDDRPNADFGPAETRILRRLGDAVMAVLERQRSSVEGLRRKEQDLRESRERQRLVFAATGLGTWDADPRDGGFACSDRAKAMLGFGPAEAVTREAVLARIDPAGRQAVETALAGAADPAGSGECTATFRVALPDGRRRHLTMRGTALFETVQGRRRAVRLVGTMTDITEHEERETFLQAILDSLGSFVGVLTPAGTVTYANRLCFEISGVPPEAVIGRHLADSPWYAYDGEVAGRIRDAVARAGAGETSHFDVRGRLANGDLLDLAFSVGPMQGSGPQRLVASAIDVTERRRSEAALRESEERFRNMADHAPVAVWMTDAEGSCTYLNRRWTELTGQAAGDGLGFGWLAPVHPEDAPRSQALFVDANGRRAPFEIDYRVRRPDGSYAWAIDAAAPRFGPSGEFLGYIGSVIDISERKAMEEALRANEERLRVITNAVPALIWVCNAAGQAIRFNDRWHEYTGLSFEQSRGEGWIVALHPEDIRPVLSAWHGAVARASSYEVETRCRRSDGTYRWMLARAEPVRDATGAIVEWIGTSTDIHDRRTAEEALRRALADKDLLLREVHHRVRNNLQAVWALVQLETLRLRHIPEARERIQAIGERVDVLGQLHQQLYRSEDLAQVVLAPYLEHLAAGLMALHGEGGRLSVAVEAGALTCDLDTALPLGLVANELVTNSLKHAFPGGRRGTIRIGLRPMPDGSVELVVEDDGIGFHGAEGPLGIGLIVVQSLAGQLDASWSIRDGHGTRARLVLPGARFGGIRSPGSGG